MFDEITLEGFDMDTSLIGQLKDSVIRHVLRRGTAMIIKHKPQLPRVRVVYTQKYSPAVTPVEEKTYSMRHTIKTRKVWRENRPLILGPVPYTKGLVHYSGKSFSDPRTTDAKWPASESPILRRLKV